MNAGCADKTVRSLENACHIGAPKRCIHDKALYIPMFTLLYLTDKQTDGHTPVKT